MKKIKFIGLSLILFVLSVNNVLAQCSLNGEDIPCDQMPKGLVGFLVVFWIAFFVFMIAIAIFWIMMLVHAVKNQTENKVMWIVILVFTQGLGAIVYYFVEKRPMDKAKKLENQNNVSA